MKIYLFNDTTGGHAGSGAVMRSLGSILCGHDVVAVHRVGEMAYDVSALNACEALLINGEGTIHHHAPAGDWLMQALEAAQARGKRTLLVNALFQQEPVYFPKVLAALDYFSVREPWSQECARRCGGRPVLLLDSCADPLFLFGGVVRAAAAIVKGDTHPCSAAHGILDGLDVPHFGLEGGFADCVASLKGCQLYITGQHHGVYAAGLAGIPFVAVPGNSHKIESLLAWSGLPIPVCRTVQEIRKQMDLALSQPELYRRFQAFLFSQRVFRRDDLDGVVAHSEWQRSRMPSRRQPAMIRVYDETSQGRKLIGSTTFFRNRPLLRTVLERVGTSRPEVSVLFHAASIGCDPYSFCIAWDLYFKNRQVPKLRVHATDLSPEFLRIAREGIYSEDVLVEMSSEEHRYFERLGDGRVRVISEVRDLITFLAPSSFAEFRPDRDYDVVFVLNALLYAPAKEQGATIDAIARYNSYLLVITGCHTNQLQADLTRNRYQPILRNLEIIHHGWTCRRDLEPGCMIEGITFYSPALEPLRFCEDYGYRFGAMFAKTQHQEGIRLDRPGHRQSISPLPSYLDELRPEVASARLRSAVQGRTVALMLHGSSIDEFQARVEEFSDLDLCYASLNLFSVMEDRILSKIRKDLAFVFCSSEDELLRRLADLTAFLARSPEKLLITTFEAAQGLGHFVTRYWRQILFVEKPRASSPDQMPNSLTVLLHTLVRAGAASRIVLLGADGCLARRDQSPVAQSYFGREILTQENRSWQLIQDTELFNQRFARSLEEIYQREGVPRTTVLNCSPQSCLTPFERISYESLRDHVPTVASVSGGAGRFAGEALEAVEEQQGLVDQFLRDHAAWNPRLMARTYKGFNICYFRERFFACDPSDGAIDVTQLEADQGADSRWTAGLAAAQTLSAVERKIDARIASRSPELVVEGYRGFNIIRYRGRHLAVAQQLGPLDPTRLGEDWLSEHQAKGLCVLGTSLEETQRTLNALNSRLEPTHLRAADETIPVVRSDSSHPRIESIELPPSAPAAVPRKTGSALPRPELMGSASVTLSSSREAGNKPTHEGTEDDHSVRGEELFGVGNYVATVMADRRDDWRTYAALGLIGKTEAALQGLGRFDDAGARFYAAAASWIAGDERIAADILEEIPTPHARNLLALIRKPQIHVLAQLPWTRKGPQDLLGGAAEDGKFVVRNISFDSHDLGNEPYADVHRYYDQRIPPDFYICAMAEWHLVPPNVQELPCPILGQTADYDLHIQTVYPWLQVFDAMVVTDHTEWHDVHRLTSVPVVTLPKSFVLPEGLQPIPRSHRKYDVLQTGTVTHPYYPDKGELLHQILADPRRAVLCVNGFLDDGAYHALLASAKVVPTYVRHSGALPTRGLEALSMGCVVAVQRGSALTLYAGEEEGVVTYDLTQRDLPSVINRVVGSWPEYERRARRGAGIVRREFRKERVASQYLRFLTVLAAQPRVGRRSARTEELDQRRRILRKGWVPGDRNVLEKVQEKNLAHLRAKAQHAPSARVFNDMARELILSHAVDAGDSAGSPVAEEVVSQILRFYRAAVDRFPASLVLRFNLVRSALHFGQPNEVSEALALAEETLHQPSSDWQVDVLEDVFPWDFANTFFNYRAYFDSATEHLASGKSATEDLARLILASLHYYLAHYSLSLEHYRAAATLDAEFPYYTLRYAHALLRANDTESRREAKRFLWQLARHSILFVDACAMLESLAVAEGSDPDVKVLRAVQDRAAESIKITEPLLAFPLRPARVQLDARTGAQDIVTSTTIDGREATENPQPSQVRPASRKDYLVSALVTTYNAERFMGALLKDLEAQTIADRLEIVIVDSASPEDERAIVDEFRRSYDNIVYLRTDERENSHVALNRAIRMARGRYLTLANADDRHRPDAFERMAAILESQPGVALVYADSAITEQANGALASSRIIGHLRLPDWDPRVLFRGCCIGPQPMWRRELHDKYGFFDPEFEICGDYEFWLRTGVRETFHHIPDVLGLYFMSSTSNERVNGIRRHQETERARRKHWPKNWGELPPWDSDYNVMDNTNGKAPLQALPPLAADSVPAAVSGLDGVAVGQAALERHAWADACDGFIRALEQDPAGGIARSGLGLALMALGDAEEGFAQLQEGVRLSPTPDAVCNLACGLIHVGRHAEARQLLEGILTVTPTHEASRANLETLSGVPEDRMTSDQGDGSPNVRLSAVLESAAGHLAHKRWPEAVTAFREVLRQAPDLAEARAALGSALLVIGRTEEAIPELRAAAAVLDTSRAWNDLGWACAVGGHVEDARATLVTAIERDPTNLEPQRNLAALFETLDMRQEAAAAYDLILLTAPGDAEAKKGKMRCGETTATSGPAVDVAGELAVTHG